MYCYEPLSVEPIVCFPCAKFSDHINFMYSKHIRNYRFSRLNTEQGSRSKSDYLVMQWFCYHQLEACITCSSHFQ